jgi:hypothetical protein
MKSYMMAAIHLHVDFRYVVCVIVKEVENLSSHMNVLRYTNTLKLC